jgi:hypothetical protein
MASDVPAKKGNKGATGILVVVVIAFLIGMFYYVPDRGNDFDNLSSLESLDNLFFSFQALASGDTAGFIDYFLAGLPVIALFLIMFGILHYILWGALKPMFKKKRYATILALAISLYAFVDQRIYDYLLNANAFIVGFLVFSVLIIFLWGLGKHGGKSVVDSHRDAREERIKGLPDRERVRELKRQLREQEKN